MPKHEQYTDTKSAVLNMQHVTKLAEKLQNS